MISTIYEKLSILTWDEKEKQEDYFLVGILYKRQVERSIDTKLVAIIDEARDNLRSQS